MRDIQLDFTAIRMNMIRFMHLWMPILMILRKLEKWQRNSLGLFHVLSVFREAHRILFQKNTQQES